MPLPAEDEDTLKRADPLVREAGKRTISVAGDELGLSLEEAKKAGGIAVALVHGGHSFLDSLIAYFFKIIGPLIRKVLQLILEIRKEGAPELTQVSAAVLSEFLGADLEGKLPRVGAGAQGSVEAARSIGDILHNRLTEEFSPDGTVSPETGARAARVFSGFAVNFGVQNAIISTLGDALSYHLLENVRDLGVETARNLGLGRLQRQALGPLIRNLIAEPYDRHLRAKYRPDMLSDRQLITAYYAGRKTREQVFEGLAKHGFKDEDIEELLQQLPPDLNQTEIVRLMRYGEMTEAEVIAMLRSMGWPEELAAKRIRAVLLSRLDDNWSAYVSLLTKQRLDGVLEQSEFEKLLARAPWADEEKQLVRDYVGQALELPRAHLSWTEVKTAFFEGVVDLEYVDAWMEREGYSEEDQLIREYLLLLEQGRKTAKEQLAEERAARKAAKEGQIPPG